VASSVPVAAGRSFIVTSGKLIVIGQIHKLTTRSPSLLAQMPFTLRLRPDISSNGLVSYTLIGEAYIHSVIEGSFVELDGYEEPLRDTIRLA